MSTQSFPVASSFNTTSAELADIDALVSLRKVLLSQGSTHYAATSIDADQAWQTSYRAWLEHHLQLRSPHIRVAVTRDPGRRVVACATGIIDDRAPVIGSLNGRFGWVQSVVVARELRQRGLARQTMEYLLCWFARRHVHRVALQTTPAALGLYRQLGFEPSGEDLLIRSSN
ncbi:GNAT family N-acetyltransferase [Burkholderia perseverans]|uniref:GNAT family N-acetyltransferase n=1 Tax=Burkholderia perseverans TaxID=2615214 RepID=UPI001FEF5739|nr:GNAT family N-acetyltransferase [Burkholderia perseverans]